MDLKGTTEEVIHPLPQAKRQQHANHWDQRRTSLKKKNGLQYISLSDLILVNIYESKDNISLKKCTSRVKVRNTNIQCISRKKMVVKLPSMESHCSRHSTLNSIPTAYEVDAIISPSCR